MRFPYNQIRNGNTRISGHHTTNYANTNLHATANHYAFFLKPKLFRYNNISSLSSRLFPEIFTLFFTASNNLHCYFLYLYIRSNRSSVSAHTKFPPYPPCCKFSAIFPSAIESISVSDLACKRLT